MYSNRSGIFKVSLPVADTVSNQVNRKLTRMLTSISLPVNSLTIALASLACSTAQAKLPADKQVRPNILFIAVDDLKPSIAAYGDKHAKTPGMDRLAREGIVFQNSYCQQAICAATRASLLTGMRPDKTRVWDLQTDVRQVNPNVISLPQYFKSMGYETAGMGKIFHMESAGPGHDAPSWSIPYRNPKCPTYYLP